MNKHLILFVLLIATVISIYAHPAGNVTAEYDAKTQLLTVNFVHKVRDAVDHYIANTTVQVNGKKAIEQILPKQESTDGGSLVYKLADLKKGDKVSVITDCNKGGKKTVTITIP